MTARKHRDVYRGAQLERQARVSIPSSAGANDRGVDVTITYTLWRGRASQGYRSDYVRRPSRWYQITGQEAGEARPYIDVCEQYTGGRLEGGAETFRADVADALSLGGVVLEEIDNSSAWTETSPFQAVGVVV